MNTHLPSNIFFPVTIQNLMEILNSSLLSGVREPIKKGVCYHPRGSEEAGEQSFPDCVVFFWGEGLDMEGAALLQTILERTNLQKLKRRRP